MIPDFPYNTYKAETANRAETEQRLDATKKIGPILFLYVWEKSDIIKFEFKCDHPKFYKFIR